LRRWATLAGAWLLLFSLVASAAPPLRQVLAGPELAGWPVVKNSYLYAAGDDLTKIYDGGYQVYLRAGVTAAEQQLYQGPQGAVLTVTVHALSTPQATWRYYQQELARASKHGQDLARPPAAQGRGFSYRLQGATYGVLRGRGTVAVASFYGGKQVQPAAQMAKVLGVLAGRLPHPK